MLEIDGSYGEGGGQILRTALGLSSILRKPFRLHNIRKGRKKPGLMPQHLMCVRALQQITGASVRGDAQGSAELIFEPSGIRPGDFHFEIGTAGSTTLLLQAILPPLVFANAPSRITLTGGTHVPFSPPYDFLSEVFIPMLRGIGISVSSGIERHGFYPKGGGRISVSVRPGGNIRGINMTERGKITSLTGSSIVANLPLDIADRQRNAADAVLSGMPVRPKITTGQVDAYSPGTYLFLRAVTGQAIAGASSLGERGKRAEAVGEEAAREMVHYYDSGACLDHHLADQIVLYLGLAKEGSIFTTSRISNHLITNLWVIRQFLGIGWEMKGERENPGKIVISP